MQSHHGECCVGKCCCSVAAAASDLAKKATARGGKRDAGGRYVPLTGTGVTLAQRTTLGSHETATDSEDDASRDSDCCNRRCRVREVAVTVFQDEESFQSLMEPSKLVVRPQWRRTHRRSAAARCLWSVSAAVLLVVAGSTLAYLAQPQPRPWETAPNRLAALVYRTGKLTCFTAKHPVAAYRRLFGVRRKQSFEQPLPIVDPAAFSLEDPHLCVLVSTYKKHGLKLTALLSSLLSAGYENLSAVLLDTDVVHDSTSWMHDTARLINGHFDNNNQESGRASRKKVFVSELDQRAVARLFPRVSTDYGYALSDLVIEKILSGEPGEEGALPEQCDYFMLTNGDNLYSSRLVPALLPYMRRGVDLVGFDYTTHYSARRDLVAHPEFRDQTMHVEWEPTWIDKGAAIFRGEALQRHNLTFVLEALRKHGELTTAALGHKPSRSDGVFFAKMASLQGVSQAIVRRTLLMHL